MNLLRLISALLIAFGTPAGATAAENRIDLVYIEKSARRLTLKSSGREIKSYSISLGGEPVGPKRCQGDERTPEGTYKVTGRNAASAFHRSLRVSYPNELDRAAAKKLGCSPGGDIMIHGLPNGRGFIGAAHLLNDWTLGCIAVTDSEIEEIWKLVADGTTVKIVP